MSGDTLAQAFATADNAALLRAGYRNAAEAASNEAESLAAQSEAKRAEAAAFAEEAERQDVAFAAAIDTVATFGVDRATAETMVTTRVKALAKVGAAIPLPALDPQKGKAKPATARRPRAAKAAPGDADREGADEEPGREGGAAPERDGGDAAPEEGDGKEGDGKEGTERREFRLPSSGEDRG